MTTVAIPAVSGALGMAGGVLLGRTVLQRDRKVLGLRLPRVKVDLSGMSKSIADAGRQFGNFASELQAAREKAREVARALS
ncbi:MAG TPA: hypothetical protein VG388_01110 [Solirubrobacteraceae bacterium]|nr:hypothetical protein [Solirubrobacteraceae bacterium]